MTAVPSGTEPVPRSTRAVTPEGVRPASVAVAGGAIAAVPPYAAGVPDGVRPEDVGGDALLPGLAGAHVHVDDPGRAGREGFATATRAAAAGGVTTVLDVPLNGVPPTPPPRTRPSDARPPAAGSTSTPAPGGGAVPASAGRPRPLHEAGVLGFKRILSPSGVPEFPEPDDAGWGRPYAGPRASTVR
ncbi:amidohydrolase family protein [Streptomyces sp. DH37]|uniref:amidohydrolase family protein n=1 Tax=Streptomyces sp. DH37 TaxID=3040122 RepID=UPI002442FC6D|nr:amidohydrolase family protein [Streptomyces sp. DH37]MDG9702337.1 amidohydrolase family protein [Streptomyces sp. DH37]